MLFRNAESKYHIHSLQAMMAKSLFSPKERSVFGKASFCASDTGRGCTGTFFIFCRDGDGYQFYGSLSGTGAKTKSAQGEGGTDGSSRYTLGVGDRRSGTPGFVSLESAGLIHNAFSSDLVGDRQGTCMDGILRGWRGTKRGAGDGVYYTDGKCIPLGPRMQLSVAFH